MVFSPILRLSGSQTQYSAFVGRLGRGFAALCIGRWTCLHLLCLVGQGPANALWARRGSRSSLFARFGQQSRCGVYLLSSGLSAAVKLFTNCKGTTVPYFIISLSIYVLIAPGGYCISIYPIHINCLVA